MRVYAPPSWRLARQLFADTTILLWLIGWSLVGRGLYLAVNLLAKPAEQTAETAQSLSNTMTSASEKVSGVPAVGGALADPFQAMAGGLASIVTSSQHQAASIHHAATVAGWTAFAIPAVSALVLWLPYRLRFILRARAARRFIDADADLELFALRAMANLPMVALAKVSDDPVRAWREGDREVVTRLAELELHRSGLSLPKALSGGK